MDESPVSDAFERADDSSEFAEEPQPLARVRYGIARELRLYPDMFVAESLEEREETRISLDSIERIVLAPGEHVPSKLVLMFDLDDDNTVIVAEGMTNVRDFRTLLAKLHELRPEIEQATTTSQARAIMRQMILRLGKSHFAIIPGDVYSDLESGQEGGGTATAGLDVRVLEGLAIVVSVEEGSPAAVQGVRPGWEILRINGAEFGVCPSSSPSCRTISRFDDSGDVPGPLSEF